MLTTATIDILLQGIVLGFSIAAPVGPIGVLCIQRTLSKGKLSGLVSGLGAATADAVYGGHCEIWYHPRLVAPAGVPERITHSRSLPSEIWSANVWRLKKQMAACSRELAITSP